MWFTEGVAQQLDTPVQVYGRLLIDAFVHVFEPGLKQRAAPPVVREGSLKSTKSQL